LQENTEIYYNKSQRLFYQYNQQTQHITRAYVCDWKETIVQKVAQVYKEYKQKMIIIL
jgi:hypothetical protein